MLDFQRSRGRQPPTPFHPALSITDDGLVCGAGAILVRMAAAGDGRPRLMVEDDAGRLVAMLSAAFNRRFGAEDVVPPVRAAAEHSARGNKAVANFRLIFARLPRLRDTADADRLRLAEYALDRGFAPDALMNELGFAAASDLRRYWEDQPRVPAGFHDQSGRWTNDPQFTPSRDKPTRVAEELPEEDEKKYETRRLEGATSRQEDIEHGRGGLLDTPGLPRGVGAGPYASEPIPAGPGPKPSTAQQLEINKNRCSECGSTVSGTITGNMVGDHQPPTALLKPGEQQNYYTHCLSCSRRQGGLVKAFKYRKDQ